MLKLIFAVLMVSVHFTCAFAGSLKIVIEAKSFAQSDTLVLYLWSDMISIGQAYNTPYRLVRANQINGLYTFEIDSVPAFSRVTLGLDKYRVNGRLVGILNEFIVNPGDEIDILISLVPKSYVNDGSPPPFSTYHIEFSGNGELKYQCQWAIQQATSFDVMHREEKKVLERNEAPIIRIRSRVAIVDSLQQIAFRILEEHKNALTVDVYNILKSDIIGDFGWRKLYMVQLVTLGRRETDHWPEAYVDEVLDIYKTKIMNNTFEKIPEYALTKSPYMMKYLVDRKLNDIAVIGNRGSYVGFYNFIKDTSSGLLRDRLLTQFITGRGIAFMDGVDSVLADALTIVRDPFCVAVLQSVRSRVIGAKAYDFSLPDIEGNIIRLSDFAGKVVFIDFWYGACAPCQVYYRNVVKPVHDHYLGNEDVVFISVNTDSYDKWRELVGLGKFTSEDAVNLYTDNQGFLHPVLMHYKISGYPTPILIGKTGDVVAIGGGPLKNKTELIVEIERALNDVE